MRFAVLAILLLAIDLYAFQALGPLLDKLPGFWSGLLTTLFWLVPVGALAFAFGAQSGRWTFMARRSRIVITATIFILYFSKVMTGIVLLLDDLRRVVAWIINGLVPGAELVTSRLTVMSEVGLMAGMIPAVLLIYGIIRNPYRYKVHKHDVPVRNLPKALDGLRIVHISDIHSGSLYDRDKVARSVELINDLEPDIVCFTGDLVNSKADEIDPLIPIFGQIRARYGVYSIVGNHDYGDYVQWPDKAAKEENFRQLVHKHERLGWDLLLNSHRMLTINDSSVAIIGVENYSAHPRFQKYGDMQKATSGMPAHDMAIVLSHDPSHWDDEIRERYKSVQLTLSGHTHGFQFGIELGKDIKWSPVQYVYKRWSGMHAEGDQYLYINRGLGFLGYPGRVGILPEITLLTLRNGTTE